MKYLFDSYYLGDQWNIETLELTNKQKRVLNLFKKHRQLSDNQIKEHSNNYKKFSVDDVEFVMAHRIIDRDRVYLEEDNGESSEANTISLTKLGECYSTFKLANYKRIWVPILISIVALIISILSLLQSMIMP